MRTRLLRPASVAALFVAAWCQGLLLASANAVARNSQHARVIDRVAQIVPPHSTLYFIPPVSPVLQDTLHGASVALLRPGKALTTRFAGTAGAPDTFAARPGLWLVATGPAATGGWQAALLEQAQWRSAETTLHLADGAELRQPFTAGSASLSAVHVAVSPLRGHCAIAYAIGAAAGGTDAAGAPLATGRLDCRRDITNDVAEFAGPPGRLARGTYWLSIRVESGALAFPVARAEDIGFAPLSYRHRGGWEPREYSLGIRSVLRVVATR